MAEDIKGSLELQEDAGASDDMERSHIYHYDRDFLLSFQRSRMCLKKPDFLLTGFINAPIILDTAHAPTTPLNPLLRIATNKNTYQWKNHNKPIILPNQQFIPTISDNLNFGQTITSPNEVIDDTALQTQKVDVILPNQQLQTISDNLNFDQKITSPNEVENVSMETTLQKQKVDVILPNQQQATISDNLNSDQKITSPNEVINDTTLQKQKVEQIMSKYLLRPDEINVLTDGKLKDVNIGTSEKIDCDSSDVICNAPNEDNVTENLPCEGNESPQNSLTKSHVEDLECLNDFAQSLSKSMAIMNRRRLSLSMRVGASRLKYTFPPCRPCHPSIKEWKTSIPDHLLFDQLSMKETKPRHEISSRRPRLSGRRGRSSCRIKQDSVSKHSVEEYMEIEDGELNSYFEDLLDEKETSKDNEKDRTVTSIKGINNNNKREVSESTSINNKTLNDLDNIQKICENTSLSEEPCNSIDISAEQSQSLNTHQQIHPLSQKTYVIDNFQHPPECPDISKEELVSLHISEESCLASDNIQDTSDTSNIISVTTELCISLGNNNTVVSSLSHSISKESSDGVDNFQDAYESLPLSKDLHSAVDNFQEVSESIPTSTCVDKLQETSESVSLSPELLDALDYFQDASESLPLSKDSPKLLDHLQDTATETDAPSKEQLDGQYFQETPEETVISRNDSDYFQYPVLFDEWANPKETEFHEIDVSKKRVSKKTEFNEKDVYNKRNSRGIKKGSGRGSHETPSHHVSSKRNQWDSLDNFEDNNSLQKFTSSKRSNDTIKNQQKSDLTKNFKGKDTVKNQNKSDAAKTSVAMDTTKQQQKTEIKSSMVKESNKKQHKADSAKSVKKVTQQWHCTASEEMKYIGTYYEDNSSVEEWQCPKKSRRNRNSNSNSRGQKSGVKNIPDKTKNESFNKSSKVADLDFFGTGKFNGTMDQQRYTPQERDSAKEKSEVNSLFNIQAEMSSSNKCTSSSVNETWKEPEAVAFSTRNYVMYILRGIPGSGKSTIAEGIKRFYSEGNAYICSADNYRHNLSGDYAFDASKLQQTHKQCQDKTWEQCLMGRNVIIIDNTNLAVVEFSAYLKMAHQCDYIVNLIETKERDPNVCFSRNTHNVPREKIEHMSTKFEDVIAHYYGWSISVQDTVDLRAMATDMIQSHSNIPKFKDFMYKQNINKIENLFHRYNMKNSSSSANLSHVTSCYTDNGRHLGARNYVKSNSVADTMGRVHELHIIGLCITKKCLFARVLLSEKQKTVWGNDDSSNGEVNTLYRDCNFDDDNPEEGCEELRCKLPTSNADDFIIKISRFIQNMEENYLLPDFGVGCTAHITLGVVDGFKPISSKENLKSIILSELEETAKTEYRFPSNLIRCYGDNLWVMYFRETMIIPAMFGGTYYAQKLS